jgi:hypothetical protein
MSSICSFRARRGGDGVGDTGGAFRLRGLRFIPFVTVAVAPTWYQSTRTRRGRLKFGQFGVMAIA